MFLNSDFNDLMAPEEALPEKGVSCFIGLLARHCVPLLKTNLLFLLGCVPVVTIPISLFAMNRAARRMMRDQPVQPLRLYRETLRRDWKRSCLAFLLTALPLGAAGLGIRVYLNLAASNPLFFLPFLVCSTVFLAALLSSGCLYGLLESGKDWKEALRLALLMGIAKPARTIPAVLCRYGLTVLALLAFPLSGLYLLLLGFSLPCMVENFFLRTLLDPFCAEEEEDSEESTEEEA